MDAVYIASQIVVSLQAIVARLSSPVEPLLIGVGKVTAGDAYNIERQTAESSSSIGGGPPGWAKRRYRPEAP